MSGRGRMLAEALEGRQGVGGILLPSSSSRTPSSPPPCMALHGATVALLHGASWCFMVHACMHVWCSTIGGTNLVLHGVWWHHNGATLCMVHGATWCSARTSSSSIQWPRPKCAIFQSLKYRTFRSGPFNGTAEPPAASPEGSGCKRHRDRNGASPRGPEQGFKRATAR